MLGRAGRAKQIAAQQAASQAALRTAAMPPANPPSPHLNPAAAVAGAQANALHGFFELLPVAASLRIHRLRPVWAAGYLEDTDKQTIATYGGIHSYLLNTWGGDAYRVELIDEVGRPLGPGWTIAIRGPVRDRGAIEDVPSPVRTPQQVLPPREYSPAPAYAPPAPSAPQAAQINPTQSAVLVDLVTQLGQSNERLLAEVQRLTTGGGAGTAAAVAAPDIGDVFAKAKRTLAQAREFASVVDQVSGGRRREERDPDGEDGDRPPVVKHVIRGLATAIGESLADDFRQRRNKNNGHGDGARNPPPRAAARQAEVEAGGDVVDGEVLQ